MGRKRSVWQCVREETWQNVGKSGLWGGQGCVLTKRQRLSKGLKAERVAVL